MSPLKPQHLLWLLLPPLLILMQYQLWMGTGGIQENRRLHSSIQHLQAENARLRSRNSALSAEVADLKQGLAAVEAYARQEFGLIKPGERFYHLLPPSD